MCVSWCIVGSAGTSHRFLCPSGVDQQVAFLILCNCSCHCSSHLIIRRNIYTTDTISWVQIMPCTKAVSHMLPSTL